MPVKKQNWLKPNFCEVAVVKKNEKSGGCRNIEASDPCPANSWPSISFQKYDGYMRHEDVGCIVHCSDITDTDS